MTLRDRLARLEANRPAPRADHHDPEPEGPNLWWYIDDWRARVAGLEPEPLPYPPEVRRRDQLASLDAVRWYRDRWRQTGLPASDALALADRMEEDALEELVRIDSGYYAADSSTNDTYREDDEE
jgi:hypothetical protein